MPASELVPIVERLVSLLSPELIFEMGKFWEVHPGRPVYHFLLVLSGNATATYAACQAVAENACPEAGTIRLLTIKKNELELRLQEGHLLYATLCQEERMVYAKDNQNIPLVNLAALPPSVAHARAELNTILAKVESFYQGALFFLTLPDEELAIFHFQQAIEHCLKGFLKAVTGRNHYSHDLVFLRRQALPFFPQLSSLLPVEADAANCLLHKTGKAYVQARYDGHFTLPVTEIKQLKEWVERLIPQAKVEFELRMAPIS